MSYIKHILVIALLICGTFLGYGFVSGGNIFFDTEISSEEALSKYVFLDSDTLNSTIISYTSNRSLEAYTLHSSCNTRSRYLSENGGVYYFKIEYVDDLCTNPYVYLSYQGGILSNTQLTLSLIRQGELVDYFGDFPEEELVKVSTVYNRMITSLQLFKTIDTSLVTDDAYGYLEKHRKYHEYVYRDQVLRSVLTGRQEAYISPVPGYQISEKTNKIPNAGRPYRNSYTDGIHHGWDIDAPK
ncbi:MAG: hypothetical protein H6767_05115 [Candidatus Peribacteria bacterium]|nr:MAG: hypothetical protein H6767_05115 [Candidatus Peribacteria bacterium]